MLQEGFTLPAVLVAMAGGAGWAGLQLWEEGGRGAGAAPVECLPTHKTDSFPTIRFESKHLLEGTEQCIPSPQEGDVYSKGWVSEGHLWTRPVGTWAPREKRGQEESRRGRQNVGALGHGDREGSFPAL